VLSTRVAAQRSLHVRVGSQADRDARSTLVGFPPDSGHSGILSKHRLRARSSHSIASSILRSELFGQSGFPKTLNKPF
jgi:hypothetical protein